MKGFNIPLCLYFNLPCILNCSEGILKAGLEEDLKKVKDDLDSEIDNLKTEIEDAKEKLEEDIGKFKLLLK